MFTNNWFEITAKANFEKYVLPLDKGEEIGILDFLEVGCYEGQASIWVMENTTANLTVVDTFKGGEDLPDEVNLLDRFKENVKKYILKDNQIGMSKSPRLSIIQGKSEDSLKSLSPILNNNFDFIYIDGSHLAKNVLEDGVLAFSLLKKGGIMIFDDYTWGPSMNTYERPCFGIDSFILVYGNQLEILERNSQLILKKK